MCLAEQINQCGRNIFYFWDTPKTLPDVFANNAERTRKNANKWAVHMVSDDDIIQLLCDDEELLELYREIWIPACRSDIARLVLLQRFGGWYLDTDIPIEGSLDRFQTDDLILFCRDDPIAERQGITGRITNMVIHAPKGNILINTVLENVKKNGIEKNNIYDVMNFSGPKMLTEVTKKLGVSSRCIHSFHDAFTGKNRTFGNSRDASTGSWKIQQNFGVLRSSPPCYNKFPKRLDENQAAAIHKFVLSHNLRKELIELIDRNPAYLEHQILRQASEMLSSDTTN